MEQKRLGSGCVPERILRRLPLRAPGGCAVMASAMMRFSFPVVMRCFAPVRTFSMVLKRRSSASPVFALSNSTGYFRPGSYGAWLHGGAANYPAAFQAARVFVYYSIDYSAALGAAQVAVVNAMVFAQQVSLSNAVLCYSSNTRDFSASVFHANCDNKGATLTVAMYARNGEFFGGYNDASWTSPTAYRTSSRAFLFDSTT